MKRCDSNELIIMKNIRRMINIKKIGFIMSFILMEIGCISFFITSLLRETIPVIGKIVSQLSDTKRYGETMYIINYNMTYIFSIGMIVAGIILCVFFYRREKLW